MTSVITRDSATGALFTCGLLLIAFSGGTFLLFDWAQAGILFCIGMAVCLITCVVSALLGERASRSDIATMAVAAAFFIWLIVHNL